MSKNFTYAFLLALFLAPVLKSSAQDRPDSASTGAERSAVNLYNKTMGDRLGLYRGPAVADYTRRSATNPNFRDTADYFEEGVINYDHRLYYHVPLLYNIERDLVATYKSPAEPFNLLSDRLISFDMLGRHFIRFVPAPNNKLMTAGFYEVLYNGKVEVLARYIKTVQTQVTDKSAINAFYPKTTYFLKKGAVYHSVNSRGSYIDELGGKDKRKELQQYLKDNKIDFSDNPTHAMILLAAYYDHLTN